MIGWNYPQRRSTPTSHILTLALGTLGHGILLYPREPGRRTTRSGLSSLVWNSVALISYF